MITNEDIVCWVRSFLNRLWDIKRGHRIVALVTIFLLILPFLISLFYIDSLLNDFLNILIWSSMIVGPLCSISVLCIARINFFLKLLAFIPLSFGFCIFSIAVSIFFAVLTQWVLSAIQIFFPEPPIA
jgi:hypothetical protein